MEEHLSRRVRAQLFGEEELPEPATSAPPLSHRTPRGQPREEAAARATYEANMDYVDLVNSQDLSFKLGENQFSDLTQEQFRVAAGLGWKPAPDAGSAPHLGEHLHSGEELADSVDWTTQGAVTRHFA